MGNLAHYQLVSHSSSISEPAFDVQPGHTPAVNLSDSAAIITSSNGYTTPCLNNPVAFSKRKGIGLIHLNIRSLLQRDKLDHLNILVTQANPDILVLSETWLKSEVNDSEVALNDYNHFRIDRAGRGGGVAIYVKSHLSACV